MEDVKRKIESIKIKIQQFEVTREIIDLKKETEQKQIKNEE